MTSPAAYDTTSGTAAGPSPHITPASEEPAVNRFATWKPLKRFAGALDRSVHGTPVEDIVSGDRDR